MLKKWANIEKKLNNILCYIGRGFSYLFSLGHPSRSQPKKTHQTPSFHHPPLIDKNALQEKLIQTSENISIFIRRSHKLLMETVEEIKKEGFTPLLKIFFQFLLKHKKVLFLTVCLIALTDWINFYGLQLVDNIRQEQASNFIVQEENLYKRPDYFRKPEKQFKVNSIILPTYLGRDHRKLVLDITFESSNKYIKAYFEKHPYLIPDVLGRKIEPISLEFPLETEGKIIIKEKIIEETNLLLEELHIKGKIVAVYIDQMVST